jgi:hypothetical protein
MVLSIVAGIVQHFRRGKDPFDLPMFLMIPRAGLWFIFSLAGVATVIFFMAAPVIRWLAKLI